jgi:hypothetical protein
MSGDVREQKFKFGNEGIQYGEELKRGKGLRRN